MSKGILAKVLGVSKEGEQMVTASDPSYHTIIDGFNLSFSFLICKTDIISCGEDNETKMYMKHYFRVIQNWGCLSSLTDVGFIPFFPP